MNYLDVDKILKSEGLNRASDINSLKHKEKMLSSKDYPWIKDIAYFLQERMNDVENRSEVLTGQYFIVDNMSCINWDKISKYSCFFPDRTVISAGSLVKANDDEILLEAKVLFNFFWGRPILCNGIADLCPMKELMIPNSNHWNEILKHFGENKDSRLAYLNKCGTNRINEKLLNHLFVAMPWIYDARLEDYFEIIQKYKDEFANYNSYISKMAKVASNEFELTRSLATEMRESIIDIQIALEKKQHELRAKGITSTVGLCLTVIPALVPALSQIIDPLILSSILGGGTLMEGLKIISEYNAGKCEKRNDPFWIMWKWNSKISPKT